MSPANRILLPHGVATFAELSLPRRAVRALLATGALERLGQDAYALPGADDVFRKAALTHATVSCVTALRRHGIDVPGDPGIVHLSVPRRRGTTRSRWIRGTRRHFEDVRPRTGMASPWLASTLDAYARAATCLPYLDAVALLDLVTQERRAGRDAPNLSEILAQVARTSATRARSLAIDVDTNTRSFRESLPRLLLRAAGLPVVAGARIPGVGEVDLLVAGRIVVEIDGLAYHADRQQFRRDRRRDRRLTQLGFVVLRYAWEDAIALEILRDLLDLLAARPAAAAFSTQVGEHEREAVTRLRQRAVSPAFVGASSAACAVLADDLASVGADAVVRTAAR